MKEDLLKSVKKSLIDNNLDASELYEHKLLSNKKEKIIGNIRRNLENCEEFIISVAFITEGGLLLLLEQFKILEKKGIKGKILTGDYLNFTEPKALKRLMSYKNIEVKILSNEKFHAKGYFFRKGDIWRIIIGSSNLTQQALTNNFEWNLEINSFNEGKLIKNILKEFNQIFYNLPKLEANFINEYEKKYKRIKEYEMMMSEEKKKLFDTILNKNIIVKPNKMQEKALLELKKLREIGENKALLISATGTGKTYLSAFDVMEVKPKKMLFIAHRKMILEKAKETFKKLIKDKKIGIYEEGKEKFDYVFAMVQTLTKDIHLHNFNENEFDYIIIDEVHHGGAKIYQKIINYFKPKFFLGMTATPERMDGFNIYKIFDYNSISEMRLDKALENDLLCPFHYFGLSDILVDGEEINEKTSIKNLTTAARVENILEKSRYYGFSGDILHGLIFVSRTEEARILKEEFDKRGVKSEYLIGESSEIKREKIIKKFELGEISYIITVDIFNEGVDIPCINQIIFLRPTFSSIVYIQQLGRGLRKNKNKEFVVVLDFIGNYQNNFLIPVAISGNNNYDKDFLKTFILNGTNMIPGESSVVFEEVAKERIFEIINKTNFSTKKNIEHDFKLLENKLGKVPLLYDFFENNLIEPSVILRYKKNYHEVLKIFIKGYEKKISKEEENFLNFLSNAFTPLKRMHEIIIFKEILSGKRYGKEFLVSKISEILAKQYNLKNQEKTIENAIKHFSKEIFKSLSTIKNYEQVLIKDENFYQLNGNFMKSYKENKYFKTLIDDLIKYNSAYVEKNYKQQGEKSILKYKEYTKQEAFWYLNLDFNNGYQVSGYTIFEDIKTAIIFVTIENTDEFSNYDNTLLDRSHFPWYSKSNRYLKRNGKLTIEGKIKENYYKIHVFMKKKISEKFYYMGEVKEVKTAEEIVGKKNEILIKYNLELKNEIPNIVFEYLNDFSV